MLKNSIGKGSVFVKEEEESKVNREKEVKQESEVIMISSDEEFTKRVVEDKIRNKKRGRKSRKGVIVKQEEFQKRVKSHMTKR